jgi:hypothetical protein
MRKQLYLAVVERLKKIVADEDGKYVIYVPAEAEPGEEETPVPDAVIKHFDVWNNNLMYAQENEAFLTPAVFVEFEPIPWRHNLKGVREAELRFNLHVISQRNMPTGNELEYAEESLAFFDLLNAVNACLHGFTQVSDKGVIDALTSINSTTDNDFDDLRHDIESYSCHITDYSAMLQQETIPAADIKLNVM